MSIDLAVLTPTYLDYTFVGLEALPGPGEERFAGDMLRTPGGGGITAVAAARLGLSAALIAPLGDDLAGRYVRERLEVGDAGAQPGVDRDHRALAAHRHHDRGRGAVAARLPHDLSLIHI